MKDKKPDQYYRLNAFADGELDSFEADSIIEAVHDDHDLHRELCDIHLIKDMMQTAYPEKNDTQQRKDRSSLNAFGMIAASVLLLVIGFGGGLLLTQNSSSETFSLSQTSSDNEKFVFYIGFSDPKRFSETLQRAEKLVSNHQGNIQIDIVASGGGVDFLKTGTHDQSGRLSNLAGKHESITFVACNNTLARLKKQGKPVDIIDDAIVAPSAVRYVVNRLRQGWNYVEI